MKIFGVLLMLVLCTGLVMAERVVPIEVDVAVDFKGEREFEILLQNGFERHFTWDEGQTHSDVTFSHTIYHELDEDKWCSDNSELDEYKKITQSLTSMLSTCKGAVDTFNKSEILRSRVTEAERDMGIYEEKWRTCSNSLNNARNESEDYKALYLDYQEKYDEEHDKAIRGQQTSSELNKCERDLTDMISDRNLFGIIGFIGGLAVGWYLWKKPKNSGPSEQAETGYVPDRVAPRPPAGAQPMPYDIPPE